MAEPDTICFDLDLALEIADNDQHYAAGLAIYALDADGDLVGDFPLVSHGMVIPAPILSVPGAYSGMAAG